MKIKEFEALTLKDCLNAVRQELGSEAVILETRKFRKGGILGWRAKDAVRIVAATGVSVNEPMQTSQATMPRPAARTTERERQPAAAGATTSASQSSVAQDRRAFMESLPARPTDPDTQDKLARLEQEMLSLKQGIDSIRQVVASAPMAQAVISTPLPQGPVTPFPELLDKLRYAEVSEEVALDLLESLPDLGAWSPPARASLAESSLHDLMAQRVKSAGPIRLTPGKTKIVAFVGPTGVGKTTTIAKLAAHFALIEKRKVALLTMDTYRIAAVDQLKTYSQIIDIPVSVAYCLAEVGPALESYKDCDLILIDTAGRSQKNMMQVSELKTLVESVKCETHLVLSASTKERDLRDQIDRFSDVGVDRVLFTKLDETTTYGTMYSAAVKHGIPLSYITTGQKVPEDIEAVDGLKLTNIVMNSATPKAL